jgi:sugar phosphate isomerase/epimerase
MTRRFTRRVFLKRAGLTGLGAAAMHQAGTSLRASPRDVTDTGYKISLAQWSLNDALFSGDLDNRDFAPYAKQQFDISAVEYVNQFFMDKATDRAYLHEMKKRADDHGVRSLLIMCDNEGHLGDPDTSKRKQAVENHHKWVDAAKQLGCHSIRVNAHSEGDYDEQRKLASDGLHRLCEYADQQGLNVLVENHGGLSSNGQWLAEVMQAVDHRRIGTLPDFGNFDDQDPYQAVKQLMPWAKGVSAKTYAFNDAGWETRIDYRRMMQIVLDADYHGYVGIEYEGDAHSPDEGIQLTKQLLQRVRDDLT